MNNPALYIVECDYRPVNGKRPRYPCWGVTEKEAREYIPKFYSWLKFYSIRLPTEEEIKTYLADESAVRHYTYNYAKYFKTIREMLR